MKKKVIVVNKFGPASSSITGKSARALSDFLISQGFDLVFVSLDAEYAKKNKINTSKSDFKGRSIQLRSWYNGKKPLLRLVFSIVDGLRLILKANKVNGDHMIIMTDPPLLYFWTTIFRNSNATRVYWTMDLYPEAFAAGKYISEKSFLYKWVFKKVYSSYPDLLITLGENQGKYLADKFSKSIPQVLLPCGIIKFEQVSSQPPSWKTSNYDKIIFGYGGNIGEAHDAEFLVLFIRLLDDSKHKILLSLYGNKRNLVLDNVKDCSVVELVDNISYQDQNFIDINIASLLPSWDNVCVPSKAVTAICCKSCLLLNSSDKSEAWTMFNNSSWLIQNGVDYEKSISEFLCKLEKDDILFKRDNSEKASRELIEIEKKAYHSIATFFQSGSLS